MSYIKVFNAESIENEISLMQLEENFTNVLENIRFDFKSVFLDFFLVEIDFRLDLNKLNVYFLNDISWDFHDRFVLEAAS